MVEKFLYSSYISKSSFLMRFLACFDLKHLPLEELLCCMGVVEYHRNDSDDIT